MWNNFRYSIPLHFVLLLTNWLPDNICFLKFRGWLAHFFLGKCGKNLMIGRNVCIYNPSALSIGDDVLIAYGCWFSVDEVIELADEVIIGPYNVFASSNHSRHQGSFRYGNPIKNPIYIGRGSWIGANCVITAGSYVGSGVCIGANSTVSKNLDNDCLYAGSPAKLIKSLQ